MKQLSYGVLKLKENPERVLSVLQIGITLVGAISAAVSGASAGEILAPSLIRQFGMDPQVAGLLAIVLIVLPLTYVSVVLGELVPKSLALRFPLRFALAGGTLLILMDRIFSPFVHMLEKSTRFFTKFVFSKLKSEEFIDTTREVDLDPLSESHKRYVFNLIDIDKRKVQESSVLWEDVTTVDISEHYHQVMDRIKVSQHSRLPVTQNGEVIGLLYTKEFVSEPDVSRIDWTELIRPIVKVHPGEPIIKVLKKLQSQKSHMAVVVDQTTPKGIVTIEDIFEEVVGEIYDEDDNPRTLLSSNTKIRKLQRNRSADLEI
ncbi:MAG: CNNM domain-containing protein [Pseudobdellovibrionaceae bacterium]